MPYRLPLVVVTMALIGYAASTAPARPPARPVFTDPRIAAEKDPDFLVQGEYVQPGRGVQVIALGKGQFRAVIYQGGLPGAGWIGPKAHTPEEKARTKKAVEGDTAAIKKIIGSMKKVERHSPTLGAKPPAGALVLFDGTAATCKAHWENGRLSDDHLLMEGTTSKEKFNDCTVHIEFRLPFKPEDRGQGRGNSGIYLQGRYEVQMLDSFGLEGVDNECGGIYKIGAPLVNMCYPPLSWQTYDIDFTAARFDAGGKKIANARMTVRHNGVLIHDHIECPHTTTASLRQYKDEKGPGPIYLQNHGNPVRYRNIWVIKK